MVFFVAKNWTRPAISPFHRGAASSDLANEDELVGSTLCFARTKYRSQGGEDLIPRRLVKPVPFLPGKVQALEGYRTPSGISASFPDAPTRVFLDGLNQNASLLKISPEKVLVQVVFIGQERAPLAVGRPEG